MLTLGTGCSPITFDLGRTGIRAAQVAGSAARPRLQAALALDYTTPRAERLADALEPSFARIARHVRAGRFRGERIAILLSPPEIQFHPLRCPDGLLSQPAERVEQALRYELAKEFRIDGERIEVRCWRLPDGHRERLNTMAAYVDRALLNRLVEQAGRCGLTLARIDATPCALARLCRPQVDTASTPIWTIADVAHETTTISTVLHDTPVYIRSIPQGGATWVEHYCRNTDSTPEAAVRALFATPADDLPPARRAVIRPVVENAVRALARQLQLCLDYVASSYPDGQPGPVFLAGRGWRLPGLPAALSASLNLPVTPVEQARGPLDAPPAAAHACAAALPEREPPG